MSYTATVHYKHFSTHPQRFFKNFLPPIYLAPPSIWNSQSKFHKKQDNLHGPRITYKNYNFEKMAKNPQKWPFLTQNANFPDFGIFFGKSAAVTFLTFWSPNFMQKIRKIVGAVFKNF